MKESKKRGGGRGRRERQRRQGARRKDEGTGKIIERGEGQEGGGRREERARQQIATGERDQGTKIPGRKADTGEHTNTGKVQGAPGLAPGCGLEPSEPKRSACLSHTPGTSGGPPSNSPACSPRRERRRVFRALFPACDVSLRIVRPSCTSLRPWNNGDRLLGVGARSALESWALGTPCEIQACSPHSGYRQARPCPGRALEGLNLNAGLETPRAREGTHS